MRKKNNPPNMSHTSHSYCANMISIALHPELVVVLTRIMRAVVPACLLATYVIVFTLFFFERPPACRSLRGQRDAKYSEELSAPRRICFTVPSGVTPSVPNGDGARDAAFPSTESAPEGSGQIPGAFVGPCNIPGIDFGCVRLPHWTEPGGGRR